MTDQVTKDLEETSSIVLSHAALLTSMFGVLQNKGLLDQADVNQIIDLALVGLETADHEPTPVFVGARRALERLAVTMGGEVR